MSLASHDKSLKYLLAQEPAAFIGFGLGGTPPRVVRPLESVLPARDRDADGGYLVEASGHVAVIHVEFYRRHQGLQEVALDVGEVQVRIARREGVPVYSHLWDLYGGRADPVLEDREVPLGLPGGPPGTRIVYRRINLRGMSAAELLERGPRSLYPLSPLTRDGASLEVVRRTMEMIEARPELSSVQRADHLVVLRFLAQAEKLPEKVLDSYLSEDKLMESDLYSSILSKGKAQGEAEILIRILMARLGRLAPEVKAAIYAQAKADPEALSVWVEDAIRAMDADAARRLVSKITAA